MHGFVSFSFSMVQYNSSMPETFCRASAVDVTEMSAIVNEMDRLLDALAGPSLNFRGK